MNKKELMSKSLLKKVTADATFEERDSCLEDKEVYFDDEIVV